MNRIVLLLAALIFTAALQAQGYQWSSGSMDGSRTGCKAPGSNDVVESLGRFDGKTYVAPSGRRYDAGTATAKVARALIDAQPAMARVKDVIAYSPEAMTKQYPEGPLSNWYIDLFMEGTERLTGKKVDIGVANFGGIRVNMPQGDVILDDMLSMFPFKNSVVYVTHRGITIRKMLESMAAGYFQVLGGVRVVAENGKLVSVEVGGEPLDDDRIYGVATNSFLLYGGDGLYLAKDAVELNVLEHDVIDVVLDHVRKETAAGRALTAASDGRIIIRK